MIEMKLSELAASIGATMEGDDCTVRGLASVETAGGEEVAFLANKKYERFMGETKAAAVIVAQDYDGPVGASTALLRCADPYFAYRQAMVAVYGFRTPGFEGIDERANIHPTATLGADARVSPSATIAANVSIGARSVIYPGVFIGENTRVGDDCTLYPNVVIYDGCLLGDRVTVHANSSIGQDGFGYATHADADGVVRHEKIPQAGWVELGDDVEIGAGCAIDRATMGPTVIGEGTKFSNLVAIGHGTKMGKHCLVVALCGLGGSTKVGNYCVFGGQVGVAGHLSIGDGVRMAGRTGVTSDIPPGIEVWGMPAIPLSEARRSMGTLRRLPQMRKAMSKLIRDVTALRRQLGLDGRADRDVDDES